MVLQRDVELDIWGWADPGTWITVRFNGAYYETKTGEDGKWTVVLPAQPAGGPYLMEVNEIAVRDILVGDVWLCSGQSNQETPIQRLTEMFPEINVANNHMIRHYKVPTQDVKEGVVEEIAGDAKWISGAKTRRLTGGLRERVDAIMVGAETVRRDDPSLLSHGARNDDLIRVVVSASGNLPESAQVFTDGKNPTLVFDASGGLEDMLRQLADQGVMWVLCEGGLKLARALADAGLVDEWITVLAPSVIGGLPVGGRRRFKADGEVVRCDGDLVAAYRAVRGDRG
jgi:riboflavin biosynthesis pyrimidine reductase